MNTQRWCKTYCPDCRRVLVRNPFMRWMECACGYVLTDELQNQDVDREQIRSCVESFKRGEWSFYVSTHE